MILSDSIGVIPSGPYIGVIQAVNNVDANNEGTPEDITYDVDIMVNNSPVTLEGLENAWRRHDNTIDGVAVTVKAFSPGVFVLVGVIGTMAQLMTIEHIKLKACPGA